MVGKQIVGVLDIALVEHAVRRFASVEAVVQRALTQRRWNYFAVYCKEREHRVHPLLEGDVTAFEARQQRTHGAQHVGENGHAHRHRNHHVDSFSRVDWTDVTVPGSGQAGKGKTRSERTVTTHQQLQQPGLCC